MEMIFMNLKKIAASGTILTILSGTILPITAYADQLNSNVNISQQNTTTTQQISQTELDKLGTYVKLNPSTKQYELLPSAKYNLSKNELDYVNKSIVKSNTIILQASKDSMLSVKITSNNTLKVESKTTNNLNTISPASIDESSYWDYEMHWWGPSIFLSNSFVQDMSANVGNTVVYFAGGATAKALEAALIETGLSSGPAGWIALAAGGEIVYDYDCIISRCSSTGVFVDVNWAGGCNIYSA
jgi:hypothetical protein